LTGVPRDNGTQGAPGDQLAAPNGTKGDPGDPGTSGHQGEQGLPGPRGRDFRLLGPDCECYSMTQDMACLLFFVSKVLNKSFVYTNTMSEYILFGIVLKNTKVYVLHFKMRRMSCSKSYMLKYPVCFTRYICFSSQNKS